MAVTQYIGARYVLNWSEDPTWKRDQAYEPLWMVLYHGNTYISRQAVPSGIEITNTLYWTRFADFNAQIEQYRSDVARLSSQVSTFTDNLESETKARQDADEALRKDFAAADEAMRASLQEKIDSANSAIAKNAEDIAANKQAIEKNKQAIEKNKQASDRIAIDAILAGADSTGEQDSSPALNLALSQLGEAGGGELLLPPGTYTVKSPLVLYSNVRIQGSGATLLADLTGEQENHAVLYWHGSGDDTLHNVRIRDVKITSKTTPSSLNDGYDGIRIIHDATSGADRKVSDIVIDGCSFSGLRAGVWLQQGGTDISASVYIYAVLSNLYAENCYSGVYVKNGLISIDQLDAFTPGNTIEARSCVEVNVSNSYLDSLQDQAFFVVDSELVISNTSAYSRVSDKPVVAIESDASSSSRVMMSNSKLHSDHDYPIRLYTEAGSIDLNVASTMLSSNLSGSYAGPIRIVDNQKQNLKVYWSSSNMVRPAPDSNWITLCKQVLGTNYLA